MKIDLHLHTLASDGTDPPEEVVRLAAEGGFDAIAITDHDTMNGVRAGLEACARHRLLVIPGVEISAGEDTDVHILGYAIRSVDEFERTLTNMRHERAQRMRRMIRKLHMIGIPIELSRVMDSAEGSVGRLHLARILVEDGYAPDIREAFAKYLSPGRPAYVKRPKLSVGDAIRLIRSAGGVPVLAHPGQNHSDPFWLGERVRAYRDDGLLGLEAYHPAHSQLQCAQFDALARRYELLITGGSDYHGHVKSVKIGDGMQYWQHRDQDFAQFLRTIEHGVSV